jgi:hypothetical protein
MKSKGKTAKTPISSIIMYSFAVVIGIIAIVYLFINVKLYNNSVTQYVAQGYAKADVTKQLIPAQLLPGIFQPVALYGGVAFILFSAGIINKNISKLLSLSSEETTTNTAIIEEKEENTEAALQQETTEQIAEAETTEEPNKEN